MGNRKVHKETWWQRTDQQVTITKNPNYTQDSTDGNSLTAYLYDEATAEPLLTGGIDVTVGTPTGEAADTDITFFVDTLTGITLTEDKWHEFVVKDDAGNVLVPPANGPQRFMVFLRANPS